MANQIFPEKIHLIQIKRIVENTYILDKKLNKMPIYAFNMAYHVMHNLESETIKIRLYVDVDGLVDNQIINQGGNYEIDFIYKIDDIQDQYELIDGKAIFKGLFVSTLLAISYSTLRGILFQLWTDTIMQNVVLPVISVPDLFKKRKEF